jgi:menaquinone-dependent protoporphyrinogen IX oxidase
MKPFFITGHQRDPSPLVSKQDKTSYTIPKKIRQKKKKKKAIANIGACSNYRRYEYLSMGA